MNYLAHIFLSGTNPDVILGNFMADGVKGSSYNKYSHGIQAGILLHREIDQFTDSHELVRASISRLFRRHRHYSSVIVDIFYDHFLALRWKEYHPLPLQDFVSEFYQMADTRTSEFCSKMAATYPHMKRHNWLYHYRSMEGLSKVFSGMSQRARFPNDMASATTDLQEDYEAYETEFRGFFPDLIAFSAAKLDHLKQQYQL